MDDQPTERSASFGSPAPPPPAGAVPGPPPAAGPPIPAPPRPDTLNTSGQGSDEPVPQGISRWSWAGFLLPTIWGGVNRVWIGLLAGVPIVLSSALHWLPATYVSTLQLPISIYCGIKGNEIAWRKRRWKSVEHFRKIQKRWAWGALIAEVALIVIAAAAAAQSSPG